MKRLDAWTYRLHAHLRNFLGIVWAKLLLPPLRWYFRSSIHWSGSERAEPANVLLIELADIGDMALASATWREVRRRFPKAHITIVVQPSVLNLVELCPYVDQFLTFEYRDYTGWKLTRIVPLRWWIKALRFAATKFWADNFDLAIVPRWDADGVQALSAALAFLSGARRRIGFCASEEDLARSKVARLYEPLFTAGVERPGARHEMEFRVEILKALGAEQIDTTMELWVSRADEAIVDELIERKHERLVALAPGAAWKFRLWPADSFAELGRWLQNYHGATVVLIGGPADRDLCAAIGSFMHPAQTINAAGKTTLRQMGALLRRCTLFVGNDSGPLHVATAAGVPVVGLYGPGLFTRFRPWGERNEMIRLGLPCSPCPEFCIYNRAYCMEGIPVAMVKASVERLIFAPAPIAQPG